jgi:outer membrane protein TolC
VEAAGQALQAARIEGLGLLRDQLEKIDTLTHHVELYERQLIPKAKQALEATRISYESGGATLQDVVLSERTLWDMESTAREHFADCQMALSDLEAIIGSDPGTFTHATQTTHQRIK